jgi:hypothetical protein
MEPTEFKPARTLEEANQRLQDLEHTLAVERERMRLLVLGDLSATERKLLKRVMFGKRVDGMALLARIKAEVEGVDGQR